MTRHAALAAAILVLAPITPAATQHGEHGRAPTPSAAAPYAGHQGREAAGLSAEEVADLRTGRGMGLALPAELNGYPGPVHVLELADALALSPAQRNTMVRLVAAMRAETVPLGEQLVEAERALDAVFSRGSATAAQVNAAAAQAAEARGVLRAAHLRVHLATRDALTETQRATYSRLRGYAPAG